MESTIRPYRPEDRTSLRQIAWDTRDLTPPADRLWPEREISLDVLTSYYTDVEPTSSWVAEADGRVVGYLTGCLNSARYARAMRFRIAPAALCRAVRRAGFWRSLSFERLAVGFYAWRSGADYRADFEDRYPGHFHINLDSLSRGQRIGRQLVNAFLNQARQAGLPGVHLAARAQHEAACRFFERMGMVSLARRTIRLSGEETGAKIDLVIYGIRLEGNKD